MARSAADATRFTATRPVVYSKASTIDIAHLAGPAPAGETPQQKVARLRDAARRARAGQDSASDRILKTGRTWADRAHRVTVLGLVGLSVLCGGVTVYSLADMWIYNARKKHEFVREQEANYRVALARAYEAEAHGTLTADLALVLNKERAVQQYEAQQAERSRRGAFQKATDFAFGGAPREEKPGGAMGFAPDEIKRIAEGQTRAESRPELVDKEAGAVRAVGGALPPSAGGMLDQMAQRTTDDARQASRSWMDWLRRR